MPDIAPARRMLKFMHSEYADIYPPDGEVRLLIITDKQFGRMETFFGKIRAPTERPPEQVTLF